MVSKTTHIFQCHSDISTSYINHQSQVVSKPRSLEIQFLFFLLLLLHKEIVSYHIPNEKDRKRTRKLNDSSNVFIS